MNHFFRNDLTQKAIVEKDFQINYPDLYNNFEELVLNLSAYLDEKFKEKAFKDDFFARYWELKLASYLKNLKNLNLVKLDKAKSNPDFCIELDNNRKIWIEAVTMSDTLEKVNGTNTKKTSMSGNIRHYSENSELDIKSLSELDIKSLDEPEILHRYMTSLNAKNKKIKEYIDKKIIDPSNDLVLIAISPLKQIYNFIMVGHLCSGKDVCIEDSHIYNSYSCAMKILCVNQDEYLEIQTSLPIINDNSNICTETMSFFNIKKGTAPKSPETDELTGKKIFSQQLGLSNYLFDGLIFNPFPDIHYFGKYGNISNKSVYNLYKKEDIDDYKTDLILSLKE